MLNNNSEIRVIELDQKEPAFSFPLAQWRGCGAYLSLNPGKCSVFGLRTAVLPDIPFFAIIQATKPEGVTGNFRIQADRKELERLGLLEVPKYSQSLAYPTRYGTLTADAYEKIKSLRVNLYTAEGEYIGCPAFEVLPLEGLYKPRGISFEKFKKTNSRTETAVPVPLKEEEFLSKISIMFSIPNHRRFIVF